MSKIINDIKSRVEKINSLAGQGLCSLVDNLDDKAAEKDWLEAWNADQRIIKGVINDVELLLGDIKYNDYN